MLYAARNERKHEEINAELPYSGYLELETLEAMDNV